MDSGRLENESVPALCRRLASESRTGCLYLRSVGGESEEAVRVYVRDGRIYTASVPDGRQHLGDRLITGGHLTQAQLDRALRIHQREVGGVRLGDVLVAEGMVNRADLREAIREQVSDTVAWALSCSAGRWKFVDGEAVAEDVPLGLSMVDTLLEAARRVDDLVVLRDRLGSLDVVVDFGSGGPGMKLSLGSDEWILLTHIDGLGSVSQIAARSGASELDVARVIYGLLSAGVVTIVGDATSGAPTTHSETDAAQRNARQDPPMSSVVADPNQEDSDNENVVRSSGPTTTPRTTGQIGRLRSPEPTSPDQPSP